MFAWYILVRRNLMVSEIQSWSHSTTLVFQQRLVAWIWHCASMDKKFLYGLEVKHLSWLGFQEKLAFKLHSSYEFLSPNVRYFLIDFNEWIFQYSFIEVYWVSLERFWQWEGRRRNALCEKRPGMPHTGHSWFQTSYLEQLLLAYRI